MKDSIFKDKSILNLSYVPNVLYGRGKALNRLRQLYQTIINKKQFNSINCLILGKSGMGKTTLARYVGKKVRHLANEKDVDVIDVYFNCINFRSIDKFELLFFHLI